jgi:hypothetical protein
MCQQYTNHMSPSTCQPCASTNMTTMCIYQYSNHVHLRMVYFYPSTIIQKYTIYECTKHVHQHVSPLLPRKYINHAPIPQQDESSYMYVKFTEHVPIKLLLGASTNILEVYQSCINYRSSYDSSIMYNMITSPTHQLHIPICSPTICQMNTSKHVISMKLKYVPAMYPNKSSSILHSLQQILSIQHYMY